jgi:hypothetical protein
MHQEIAQLLAIRARAIGSPAALALVHACLEFCFRSEIANDDPRKSLTRREVDQFLTLMGRLKSNI